MAGFMPLTDLNMVVADNWAKEVERRSEGRIKITRHWAQSLVKAADTYQAVKTGLVDIGLSAQSYEPTGQFPLSMAIGLPWGFTSCKAVNESFKELYNTIPAFSQEYAEVKNLFIYIPGLFQIHTVSREILLPGDLKGLQIRGPGGVVTDVLKAWGATPVSMPMSEAYMSLQKGIVDGIVAPYVTMMDQKLGELTKYTLEGYYCTNPFMFVMNKEKFAALPADLQNVIDEVSDEWWTVAGETIDEADPLAKPWLVEQGVAIHEPSDQEMQAWRETNEAVVMAWAREAEAKGTADAVVFAEQALEAASAR